MAAVTKTASDKALSFSLLNASEIDEARLQRMFALLSDHYDRVSYFRFLKDLSWKHFVGLLSSPDGTLRGFTTFAINPVNLNGCSFNIVFSGDTIIDREYWGTQELVRGFVRTVGQIYSGLGGKTLYWFLISKGHRTYLYLPYFFKKYYPALDSTRSSGLSEIAGFLAQQMFDEDWDSSSGLIRCQDGYSLKPALSDVGIRGLKNKHVQYFLGKNPYFARGEELACIAEIHPDNFLRACRRFLLEGMQNPLPIIIEDEDLDAQPRRFGVAAG